MIVVTNIYGARTNTGEEKKQAEEIQEVDISRLWYRTCTNHIITERNKNEIIMQKTCTRVPVQLNMQKQGYKFEVIPREPL